MKTILWSAKGAMTNIADSALQRDVMPLFVPDGVWHGSVALAYRIGRLGKHIREKFAMRYIDAVQPVLLLRPGTVESPEPAQPWLSILDGAITAGGSVPFADEPVTMQMGELTTHRIDHQPAIEAIADVTSYGTIKTGDLIVPMCELVDVDLVPNTHVVVSLDGTRCLNVKVK